MERKVLFQTLENRYNIEEVEKNGPFRCSWNNTWLGHGYYYWEAFIQNAHWWGNMRYEGNHIICECDCHFKEESCFDLVGSTNHLTVFSDSVSIMKSRNLITLNTTVARVLYYMRNTLKIFKYEAVRAYGIGTISKNREDFTHRILFEPKKNAYLDVKPAIQICIYEKFGCQLSNYRVIYPEQYDSDYMV